MNFDYAALERRIAALENSQTASLRMGRVTGISGGKVRVEFADGQKMNSFELSTLQKRVLKDQDIEMPDIGEPVAVLFSGQGCEQGVLLGAYYNGQEGDPGQPAHMDYKRYSDGTELWYDREAHKLIAKVKGDITAEGEKTAKLKAKEEIEAVGEKTITAKAQEDIHVESQTKITLKAPAIEILGVITMMNFDGSATEGTLKGNFNVIEGDVTAESVSLRKHQHEHSGGSGVGGKPVGG